MDLTTLKAALDEAYTRFTDAKGAVEAAEAPTDDQTKALDDAAEAVEKAEKALDAGELRAAKVADIEKRRSERSDRRSKPITLPHQDPANKRHQYNPAKALRGAYLGTLDGIEAEEHQELVKIRAASGLTTRGVVIPLDAEFLTRAAVTTTTGAGAIAEVVRMPLIDALMAQMVLPRLGVSVLPADGPFKLPRSTSATSYFVGEDVAPADGSPALDAVSFALHTAAAKGRVTRMMMISASIDAEAWLMNYLLKAVAARIQIGAFTGPGSGGAPKGFFALTNASDGINEVSLGTNGSALDRNKLLAMIAPVVGSNAAGPASFLTNSKVTSKLEATPAETGYPVYLYDPGSEKIVGRPVATTDHVPGNVTTGSSANTSHIAYGVWGESAVSLFSGLDVVFGEIDDAGGREVRVFQDMDFHVLQPKAFTIAKGVVTA